VHIARLLFGLDLHFRLPLGREGVHYGEALVPLSEDPGNVFGTAVVAV
jgi:hypothetical protein